MGMNDRRRMLPPISVLNSFAAAARTESFSKAGDAVGLTQSAVSRHIALLEDWVRTPLFDRVGRGVRLNPQGRAYAEEVDAALDRIRGATSRLVNRHVDTELTIATLPSFGMRWLAPRLPGLATQHPTLIVNLAVRSSRFDFAGEAFDAAIHFGRADWPRADHDFLFREMAVPVCAPDWLRQHPIATPADMVTQTLLVQTDRRDAWSRWFAHAGVPGQTAPSGPAYEHFLMIAEAAAAGAGIALLPRFLIEPELRAGTLVVPLDLPLTTDDAYYLVSPAGVARTPALEKFRRWIRSEAERM